MSEHTKVPWEVEYDNKERPRAIKDTNGEHVTYIDGSRYADDSRRDPEAEANARFITLACNHHDELVAELRHLIELASPRDAATSPARALLSKIEGAPHA